MRNIFLTGMLLLLALPGTQLLAQTEAGTLLIQHGTVITISDGTLEDTDVLIENGIIKRVGKGLKAPANARVVDATGKFVMPGIIDAHSHIAIDAVNESTNPVTAEVWTGDVVNPLEVEIYHALAGGVTTIHAMHGSANAIGGQCETLKLRYGVTNPHDMRMEGAPRTIKFALGENPLRVHGLGRNLLPRSRMGIEQLFRSSFEDGKAYDAEWKAYQAALKRDPSAIPPEYDLRKQTLADILNGDIIIHCHSYRADEILMLMKVCKDYGITKLVFQHVNEGYKVAPELAEFGAGASVFSDWWAYKFEVYYSTAFNATILTQNGVVTSINSDDAELMRHLYHEAAKTQRYGQLSDEEALKLITINPAKQLGIEDRVGSIEVGKEGDIAIFSHHPLSIYTIPVMTIIDGVVRFDRANDPSDMRLYPDPDEAVRSTIYSEEEDERCMQDVLLFEK
ncbi:MAG: amidohydrolase [Bacteroidia bacterium]|nr:amidohydrolase [Bacteroidia bacterium]